MLEIMDRLQRKLRLLKVVLGIKSKAQAANLSAAIKGKWYASGKNRMRQNPRAALEFYRCGQELQRMNRRIQAMKAEKRGIPLVQHGWQS